MNSLALSAAFAAIDAANPDPLERVKARSLILGYDHRYLDRYRQTEIIAVEPEFKFLLMNPSTSGQSKSFDVAGKIDAIIREGGQVKVVEHKTSGESIEPDASYWDCLAMDTQISAYFLGASSLGHEPEAVVYDVIRKPAIRVKKDESIEQFGDRLAADVIDRPEFYYATRETARLDSDILEYMEDVWAQSQQILYFCNRKIWPRNPSACTTFGICEYFPLCTRCAEVDGVRFAIRADRHAELDQPENGHQLLTNSRLYTLRECPRKHQLKYEDQVERVGEDAPALRFGALFHKALEAWFKELQHEHA